MAAWADKANHYKLTIMLNYFPILYSIIEKILFPLSWSGIFVINQVTVYV